MMTALTQKALQPTKVLLQVGQDVETSAICIAVLWFGLDEQR
jgi:hypothetical protein